MNVYFSTYLARFSSSTLCGLQCGQHFQLHVAKRRKWQHNENVCTNLEKIPHAFSIRGKISLWREKTSEINAIARIFHLLQRFLASFELSFLKRNM